MKPSIPIIALMRRQLHSSLSASIHNFFSRLILEKEIGDRFDIRVGLGMGIGIVTLKITADYSGTGFAYDFLVGGAVID